MSKALDEGKKRGYDEGRECCGRSFCAAERGTKEDILS
jgi:hypothetical protein